MFVKIGNTVLNTDQIVNIDFEYNDDKPEESLASLYMSDGTKQTFYLNVIEKVLDYIGFVEL